MHDIIVIGGSYAGLSAAMQLARARKDVLIIDAGLRRNRFASESHGFLSRDGSSPDEIAAEARRQLLAYPTVTWLEGTALEASGEIDNFRIRTDDGRSHLGRRVVLAMGVKDVLPDIPGLDAQWGAGAVTCPYCHGYELDRGPLAVIATGPLSLHHAAVVSEWGPTTFLPNGALALDAAQREDLTQRGIALEEAPITRVAGPRGQPVLVLADGRALPFAGLFVATTARLTSDIAVQLGCELADTPVGRLLKVDAGQATSTPGIFACGDAANPMASIALAVGSGAMAGAATHRSLIFPPAAERRAA